MPLRARLIPATLASALLMLHPAVAMAAEDDADIFAGEIYQAVAALLAFTILVLLLRKYAWGPLLKGLKDREDKIRNDLADAEKAAADARKTLEQYQQQLNKAHEDAKAITEQAKREAEAMNQQLRQQTERELQVMRQRAREDIAAAAEQALASVYEQAAVISSDIAARILQREVNAADHEKMVGAALEELNRTGRN